MKLKQILLLLVILSLMFGLSEVSKAQAQAQYSLDLEMVTWNHSTLSVLVVSPQNASWWNPSFLNSALQAITEWNTAIQGFASNYTDYAYLSALSLVPTSSDTMNSGFDITISWTQKLASASDEIGYTNITYSGPSNIIGASTTDLAAQTSLGYNLNEIDMQNVALHELGHSLGLGHSSYSNDIMYPVISVNPADQVQALSTLDLYGVSTVFQWMLNSKPPYSPQQSSVMLPSNLTYTYLPTSNSNQPSPSPYSSLLDQLLKFITSGSILGLPTIIIMIIPFIIGLILGFLIRKFLLIVIIVGIIVIIISYLGLFNLSLSTLGNLATQYGLIAIHYAVLLIGILPLGIGFILGLIIGFIFG